MNPPKLTPEALLQDPLLLLCLSAFTILFFAFVAGALASWALIGYRLWKKQPLLETANWSPRVWGFADIVVAVFLLFMLQNVLAILGVSLFKLDVEALRNGDDPPLSLSALISLSYLVAVVLTILWIVTRYRVGLTQVGIAGRRAAGNLRLGLIAGFAILPFIYLLSAVVNLGFETDYNHPLLDSLRKDGTFSSFLLAVFAAVVAAPLAEEWFFRVLLQGWLQSIPSSSLGAILLGASPEQRSDPTNLAFFHPKSVRERGQPGEMRNEDTSSIADQRTPPDSAGQGDPNRLPPILVENESINPYSPDQNFPDPNYPNQALVEKLAPETEHGCMVPHAVPPIWPSLLAGTLFGLAHWGYGLSFIPLIVLGIALGLLYRATQSVWPCVVVHFMLNASSMLALGVSILVERANS